MAYRAGFLATAVLGISMMFGGCAYRSEVIPAARIASTGPRPPQYAEVFGRQYMEATIEGDGRTLLFTAGLFVEEGDSIYNVRIKDNRITSFSKK